MVYSSLMCEKHAIRRDLMTTIKRIASIVLTLAIIFTAVGASATLGEYPVSQELREYGAQVYSAAKSSFGHRSFSGYCGTYVRLQLHAMGILNDDFDFHGNGNKWYGNLKDLQTTPTGYYAYSESGENCLKTLAEKYGNDLKNIVISFPIQSGYSASRPGAGHAFIIYELKDGIAYYSESFSFGNHREGSVIAEDVDSLIKRYSRRHGNASGCVMFADRDMTKPYCFTDQPYFEDEKELALGIFNFTYFAENILNSEYVFLPHRKLRVFSRAETLYF